MLITVAQTNPTVGDFPGNLEEALKAIQEARRSGAELVVFPELALLGYPPGDLLHCPGFLDDADQALEQLLRASQGLGVVLGHVVRAGQGPSNTVDPSSAAFGAGHVLHNAVLLAHDGAVVGRQVKHHLPSFDVFEEQRYFTAGHHVDILPWRHLRLGLSVCEDLWYEGGVLGAQAEAGVDLIVNVSASPYFQGKGTLRRSLAERWAAASGAMVLYTNMAGGQDELVFDGGSFAVRPDGAFLLAAPPFASGIHTFDTAGPPVEPPTPMTLDGLRQALVIGIRDYVEKNSLDGVWVAISGGVDSALVAALAGEALGPDRVSTVFMPGPHTAPESREQALALAEALNVPFAEILIQPVLDQLNETLRSHATVEDLVAENLQARVRGLLLMALCNATDRAPLCPANKAEIAVGYNTLYGDSVGALAPIGDLLKRDVYALAHLINAHHGRELIPAGTLKRPPSAELRPAQRDDQDLPPYEQLDPLLSDLLVDNRPTHELCATHGEAIVHDVLRRLHRSEYKRRQLPIVIKVTPKAFGTGRRVPVTHRYKP